MPVAQARRSHTSKRARHDAGAVFVSMPAQWTVGVLRPVQRAPTGCRPVSVSFPSPSRPQVFPSLCVALSFIEFLRFVLRSSLRTVVWTFPSRPGADSTGGGYELRAACARRAQRGEPVEHISSHRIIYVLHGCRRSHRLVARMPRCGPLPHQLNDRLVPPSYKHKSPRPSVSRRLA